jgi:hypothetical protein
MTQKIIKHKGLFLNENHLLQWMHSSSRPQNDTKNYEAQGFIVE